MAATRGEPGDVWVLNDSYLDRHAPERHDRLLADLPRGRAGRLRRLARALARRRREGSRRRRWTRPTSTRRASGWGRSRSRTEGACGPTSSICSGATLASRTPRDGDLMAQIACARTGDKRLRGDRRAFGLETVARRARRDLRADRAARARGRRGDPRRRLRGRGLHRQRRRSTIRRSRISVKVTVDGERADDRPDRHRRHAARPGQLRRARRRSRRAASRTRLLINPERPAERRRVPAARGEGARGLAARGRGAGAVRSGTSRRSAC